MHRPSPTPAFTPTTPWVSARPRLAPPSPAPVTAAPLSPQASFQHVVYSPFAMPPPGIRALGTSWEPHSKYKVVRHGDSATPLAFVHPDTVVYIVSHCGPGLDWLEDNGGNKLSSAEVAQRLADDGLTIDIQAVKLYACSGGSNWGSQPSFASLLLRDMRRAGFSRVKMQAYTATVSSLDSTSGKKTATHIFTHLGGMQLPQPMQVKTPAHDARIDVIAAN